MNTYRLLLPLPASVDQIRESRLIPAEIVRLIYTHAPNAMFARQEMGRRFFVVVEVVALVDVSLRQLATAYRATFRDDPCVLLTIPCLTENL